MLYCCPISSKKTMGKKFEATLDFYGTVRTHKSLFIFKKYLKSINFLRHNMIKMNPFRGNKNSTV